MGLPAFGKTYLTSRLARLRTYGTVHDAKGTYRAPGMVRYTRLRDLIKTKAAWTIYAPDRAELRDDGAKEAYFEWCYLRGNTTVIVDELTSVATSRSDMPEALYDLYARGREFGSEVWGCTQEPVHVPQIAITQARNRYCFYVAYDRHQLKVVSVMPGLEKRDILDLQKKEFYYYREGEKTIDPRGPFFIERTGVVAAAA